MDFDFEKQKMLAQTILEMPQAERLRFVSDGITDRTLTQTMRRLNALGTSGDDTAEELAHRAVASLGFVRI